MGKTTWTYERLNDEGKVEFAPYHDLDGKVTGRHVYGLKAWFDENPEERKRMGWIKHLHPDIREIEYDHNTQYLSKTTVQVDEWTVKDEYHVMDKSEEMMRMDELTHNRYGYDGGLYFEGVEIE